MNDDISAILSDWPYEPGKISVRRIMGVDGRTKIQLRLDLGLLQMDVDGRPDGRRPHGCESLLHYFLGRLDRYRLRHDGDEGFELDAGACEAIRGEAVMYYHRYLSEFALEDFDSVIRDTARNLEALDFCLRYAASEEDQLAFEQHRPYIVMMNARATALKALNHSDHVGARAAVTGGLETIRLFAEQFGQFEQFDSAGEVTVLNALLEEIERQEPRDPVQTLEASLEQAVEEERYEDAARLRDQLRILRGS